MAYNDNVERLEAIKAGENALKSLRHAKASLSSARGWGIYDILKGKTITGLIKHSKLSSAKAEMEQAKWDLEKFNDELDDISGIGNLQVDIGAFATVADFIFDGLIADIYVQSKIKKALDAVNTAIKQVEDALRRIR